MQLGNEAIWANTEGVMIIPLMSAQSPYIVPQFGVALLLRFVYYFPTNFVIYPKNKIGNFFLFPNVKF
jgi:hypothetical protein